MKWFILSILLIYLLFSGFAQQNEKKYSVEVPEYIINAKVSTKKMIAQIENEIMKIPDVVYAQVVDDDFTICSLFSPFGRYFSVRVTLSNNRYLIIRDLQPNLKINKYTALDEIGGVFVGRNFHGNTSSGVEISFFNIQSKTKRIENVADLIEQYDYLYSEIIKLKKRWGKEQGEEPSFGYRISGDGNIWYLIYRE